MDHGYGLSIVGGHNDALFHHTRSWSYEYADSLNLEDVRFQCVQKAIKVNSVLPVPLPYEEVLTVAESVARRYPEKRRALVARQSLRGRQCMSPRSLFEFEIVCLIFACYHVH